MRIQAVYNLYPQANRTVGDSVFDVNDAPISVDEGLIAAEIARLEAEYARTEYQRQRAAEYPPMTDYLDGVVKGDQAQIDKYIADCLAVKAKYPKP